MYDCTLHMFIKHLGIVHKTESDWVSWDKSEKSFHIQFKLVYPLSLSLELGTFNEVAPALNSLLELTNGGENYTIKAIFQWKLQGEIFIVTITKTFHPHSSPLTFLINYTNWGISTWCRSWLRYIWSIKQDAFNIQICWYCYIYCFRNLNGL